MGGGDFAKPCQLAFGQLARGNDAKLTHVIECGVTCQLVPHLAVADAAHGGQIGMQIGIVLLQSLHFFDKTGL